ncbi:probable two-component hybrid sensor-regulator protein [Candidatus Vecturithrix granuli]|uniref:Probable two-component hybrid sensor-regulator protein n=1 Tax=Vecturithrix granuli TaxID=1499967 RepID=A0A081C042_VECG1|nr:probable two-component hybrid sensor-regulator protein [Candidatus Vecturithrix granuli]
MNQHIRSEIIHKQHHISIMGLMDAPEDQQCFLAAIQQRDGVEELHITVFEAKFLPAMVIEALKAHVNQYSNIPLKLFILHRHLSLYLSRLGLQNRLVFEKSLLPATSQQIRAVAIGGSAESLDKIFLIVKSLPLADISVFIVQHFPKDARNILDTLLLDKTRYRTVIPQDGTTIETNAIYIAPSDFHLKVEHGVIRLTKEAPVNYSRPSIDVLFESLSQEYKQGLLAILLCGYGSDGSHSLKTLAAHGARILIEDPLDCSARDMPQNALKTGYYHYKFPIQELAHYVSRIIRKEEMVFDHQEIMEFLNLLHKRYGYDYQEYSVESIKRRLQKMMLDRGFSQFEHFSSHVLQDSELFEELFLEFSINVTHFFRNPEVFYAIREKILPYLDTYPHIKIWCAGCSTGEEPYSLAMLLDEADLLKKSQIYATDINPFVIAEAKNGLYSMEPLDIDQQNYQASGGAKHFLDYFDQTFDILKIKPFLREKILFFQHSLVNSGILNEFQLILCRNVLIYFNQTLQKKTLRLFAESLDRRSFLILGESEALPVLEKECMFEEFDPLHKIFRKRKFVPPEQRISGL